MMEYWNNAVGQIHEFSHATNRKYLNHNCLYGAKGRFFAQKLKKNYGANDTRRALAASLFMTCLWMDYNILKFPY